MEARVLRLLPTPSSVSATPIHLLPPGEKEDIGSLLPSLLVGEGARRADEGEATDSVFAEVQQNG